MLIQNIYFRQKKRGTERENLVSIDSFPRSPRWPELDEAEARNFIFVFYRLLLSQAHYQGARTELECLELKLCLYGM